MSSNVEGTEREGLREERTCKSEGDSDGRIVRDAEGALRDASDQSQEERNGDPVHLFRHPHRQRGSSGGTAGGATTGASGVAGCLKRITAESSGENFGVNDERNEKTG